MSDLVYLLVFASKKRFNALQNVIVTNSPSVKHMTSSLRIDLSCDRK